MRRATTTRLGLTVPLPGISLAEHSGIVAALPGWGYTEVWSGESSGFDAFTPLSHHGRTDLSPTAQRNRLLLMGLMTAAGWDFYRNEWWHYQLFEARRYPLVSDADLPRPMM